MNIRPTVRPLPWFSVSGEADGALLAQALRTEFLPKIARRLPGHHLVGFRHDATTEFVRNNKKRYPYFLRTDISKFYQSIRHRDMIVEVQLAYRDLLGLDYVPWAFKSKYVGAAAGHLGRTVQQLDALGLRSLAAIHAGAKTDTADGGTAEPDLTR